MSVALIKPPAIEAQVRGAGVYGDHLISALKNHPETELEVLGFKYLNYEYSQFDLVHYLYFDPFFLTLAPINFVKTVVTVFDLTSVIYEKQYPRGVRGEIKWQIQKNLLQRTDKIITISQASKDDIARILNISPSKIAVTYLAADTAYRPISDQKRLAKVKKNYYLPGNFILYVGDVNYNKNLLNLLKAFAKITSAHPDLDLVMVGRSFNTGVAEATTLKQLLGELKIGSRVHFPGFVPTEDLAGIYNLAKIHVHPAIYEGFGITILEAMACGTPVICGRNSSLLEVGGDVVLYSDVENPDKLAKSIDEVLRITPVKVAEIKETEIRRSKRFSWEKTASETVKVYESLTLRNDN